MDKIPVKNGTIEFEAFGPEDGAPIVFIHGSGLAKAFLPVAEDDALADFRRIRVHRRGYAGSSKIHSAFNMRQQAEDIVALMDNLGLESAHLAGHSYGGGVSLQTVFDAPERVETLTLIDSMPPPGVLPPPAPTLPDGSPNPFLLALQQAGNHLKRGQSELALEAFFSFVFGEQWRAYFDAVDGGFNQSVADVRTALEIEMPAIASWHEVAGNYESISQPVMVAWGIESALFGPHVVSAWQQAFPGAKFVGIPGTDHALITQNPSAVATNIESFLTEA